MATYTLISSNVLTSSAASVTFSSIPATYTDLVVRLSARATTTASNIWVTFNGTGTGGTALISVSDGSISWYCMKKITITTGISEFFSATNCPHVEGSYNNTGNYWGNPTVQHFIDTGLTAKLWRGGNGTGLNGTTGTISSITLEVQFVGESTNINSRWIHQPQRCNRLVVEAKLYSPYSFVVCAQLMNKGDSYDE